MTQLDTEDPRYNAENLSVSCDWPHCNNGHLGSNLQTTCPDCHGSGRRYLLRDKCRHCNGTGVASMDYGQASFYIGCTKCGGVQKPQRPHRSDVPANECGNGYVPVTDLERILAAIRERGWVVEIESDPDELGDWVGLYNAPARKGFEAWGECLWDDKLRGTAAVSRALRRALEAVTRP